MRVNACYLFSFFIKLISIMIYQLDEGADTPWIVPDDTNTFVYILRWPITFVLWLTLPDCRKHPNLKMFTFFSCIVWIGITSYAVAMTITIIGARNNWILLTCY